MTCEPLVISEATDELDICADQPGRDSGVRAHLTS